MLKDKAALKILAYANCANITLWPDIFDLLTPLPVNRFSNKVAPNVPNNILRNRPVYSFALFLIVLLMPFITKPDSSRDLTIFMILISSLETITVVVPDPNIFLWIPVVAVTAAVNSNGIKILLASNLSAFFIKGNPVFGNHPKSATKNPPDCPISCNWVFDNFILADELYTKALESFGICVLVNNNACGKLFASLESLTTFDESFKVTSVQYFCSRF